MLVRRADPSDDAAACATIYAPFVRETAVSFEEDPPSTPQFRQRMQQISRAYPWLVADEDEEILGYAYACEHRDRAAYRWATDVTVYVAHDHQRRGVGRALYDALLPLLTRQGFHSACAGITLPNEASVALHEACGFTRVGIYRRIGWKAGAWRDVGWWQRQLVQPSEGVPAEPGPPAGLRAASSS